MIAEAARLMPDRVIDLIGVDTLENLEFPLKREELDAMVGSMRTNCVASSRPFISSMIYSNTAPGLRDWILADMSAAPPVVAASAMKEMMMQFISGDAAKVFDQARVPVISVNGDLWDQLRGQPEAHAVLRCHRPDQRRPFPHDRSPDGVQRGAGPGDREDPALRQFHPVSTGKVCPPFGPPRLYKPLRDEY